MNNTLKMLPNNALLNLKEIACYTGVKAGTLGARVVTGLIPRPEANAATKQHTLSGKSRHYWTAKYVRENIEIFS